MKVQRSGNFDKVFYALSYVKEYCEKKGIEPLHSYYNTQRSKKTKGHGTIIKTFKLDAARIVEENVFINSSGNRQKYLNNEDIVSKPQNS